MSLPSLKTKCLFVLALLIATQSSGQNLIKDSWSNAGLWFKTDSYTSQDAWYWGLGLSAVGAGFVWDEQLQSALSFSDANRSSELSPFMEPFGNPYTMGSAFFLLHAGGLITKNESLKQLSSTALQSMLTAGATVMVLKLAFHRIRPEEQMLLDPYRYLGPSLSADNLSFPSGHTAIAFSLASSISALYDDRLYLALPLYGLAGLTAWQRVYDQKHWPSDVLMGGLIGVFVGRKIAKWQKERGATISLSPALLPNSSLGFALRLPLDS